jgi:membrane-bound lytic murein transglycosylase B
VIQSDRSQAELTPGFEQYRSRRMNDAMVRQGRELAGGHAGLLSRIEQEYGVQRRFVLAIWGLESRFGAIQGRVPVFQALATLAWEPRRAAFFRGELFNALTMVQRGHIDVSTMTGSWAGAMGQTQFMPSSYLDYAQDFDGDGRRDIWTSTPDALASIANYLRAHGWTSRETWGREVSVPASARAVIERDIPRRTGGCAARRDMTERRPLAAWDALGVRLAGGGALPTADLEAGLVDVGERQFLVYPNYDALLAYNCAHYYALTVTLLAERLR